jgi:hypothetical protein
MKPFSGLPEGALDQDQGPVQVPALVGQGVAHEFRASAWSGFLRMTCSMTSRAPASSPISRLSRPRR